MRLHDGPLELIPGGPFTSGEMTAAPDDWTFLSEQVTLQFQTLSPSVSRTIWMVVHDGRLFLTTSNMNSAIGFRTKRWPSALEADDRVIIRVDDLLYEQRLQRISSGPDILPVLNEFERKYSDGLGIGAAEVTEGYTWMFEVVDR